MLKLGLYSLSVGIGFFVTGTPPALAQNIVSEIKIKLTIGIGCSVVVVKDVDFGVWSTLDETLSAEGSVMLICSEGLQYTVGFDGGQAGDVNRRQLIHSNGVDTIDYQIYRDQAHKFVWGNRESLVVSGVGTGHITGIAGLCGYQRASAGYCRFLFGQAYCYIHLLSIPFKCRAIHNSPESCDTEPLQCVLRSHCRGIASALSGQENGPFNRIQPQSCAGIRIENSTACSLGKDIFPGR